MLQLDDLRRLRTPSALADVYHLLGYPADQEAPEYTPDEIDLSGAAGVDVSRVWLLVDLGEGAASLQHVHFEVKDLHAATLRRITENFLKRPGEYLLTFAPASFERLVFIKPRREGIDQKGGGLKLGKLTVQPSRPTQHDLAVLREIAVDAHTDPQQAHQKQIKAFNVERVTRKFFDEYKALFLHTREVIKSENPNAKIGLLERNRVEDKPSLHAFTQRLLGRIIFLYFIQKKGWLNDNQDFLSDLYKNATAHAGSNFYRDALEILFFEVLNSERPDNDSPLGSVPYLNGSLFEREYPTDTILNLPNSLFDPRESGSILNVLGGYNFTVSESGSLDQEISLDPEMLGKVFENMMEEDEAAQSGTFYTPRSIVQFMAEETLTRYLADHTGLTQERLLALIADDSEAHDLTTQEAAQIIRALGEVRVFDPAVGTASMLVGFLNAMIRVRRSAEAKRGIQVSQGSPALAQWKREYIQHALYGVDIKQEAIEIARLRLWLSLVVDAQEPEPLPNLDYKLMAGDGLLETVDGTAFTAIQERQDLFSATNNVSEATHQINRTKERFYETQDPTRRRALREEIQNLEREVFRGYIDHQIDILQRELDELAEEITRAEAKVRLETTGDKADARKAETQRKRAEKKYTEKGELMGRYVEQRLKVLVEKEPLPFFLHHVHFTEVMEERGGFDIVIGNPPYVSIGNMKADYKTALKQAFPEVESGRADLYVYFYQKGLNLLRQGGRLAYITPNKFMRAGYGEKLRGVLSKLNSVELLADFGDLPVFDATTYPLIAMLKKAKPSGSAVQMLPERTLKTHLGAAIDGGVPAVREALNGFHHYARDLLAPLEAKELTEREWTLDDPRVLRLMDKLRKAGKPLGEVVEGKFYYGIKTGYNDAFVIDEAKRAELIATNPKSAEVIKPFLRGRDVRRWKAEWAGLYLLAINRGFELDKYPAIKAHLEGYREPLSRRATVGNHEWYELQQPQERYQREFEKDKIFWPHFSSQPMFVDYLEPMFVNDKGYAMPRCFRGQSQILNSRAIWAFIKNISPPVRGGYQENRIIYMEQGEFKLLTHAPDAPSVPQVACDNLTLFGVCYSVNAAPVALPLG